MNNIYLGLIICLLLYSCEHPQPSLSTVDIPIELGFEPVSAKEMEGLTHALRKYVFVYPPELLEVHYLKMSVKNNVYDSLFMHLDKIGKYLVERSDVLGTYRIEQDTLIEEYEQIMCSFKKPDTIICLKKGESTCIYFEGRCANPTNAFEYNFRFSAYRFGQQSFPEFKQFTCWCLLP